MSRASSIFRELLCSKPEDFIEAEMISMDQGTPMTTDILRTSRMWFSISVCLQLFTNYEEVIQKYLLPGIQRCIHKSMSGQEEPSEYEADDVNDHDDHDDEEEIEEL